MSEWSDKFKLGKSAFIKKDIRPLPQTEVEFEADFFFDCAFSTKRQERWIGLVIERAFGGVLAMEDVQLPPPTVNDLATPLASAMTRPPDYGDRQRPRTIYLRDRPQWQELIPHLQQLGIEVVLTDGLPWFDEAVVEWMQQTDGLASVDEIKATLRKPFPERKRTLFTDAMDLMEWTGVMSKGAYPSRKMAVPLYDPMTFVPIQLTAAELEAILTKTEIAKTKKLRPRLEAMAVEGRAIELDIHEWSRVLLALCGGRMKETAGRKHLLGMRAHIFLCMLAYYVQWHMTEAWRPLLFADEDQESKASRDPVAPAERSDAALQKVHTKQLDDDSVVHSFRTLLDELSRIVSNICRCPDIGPETPTFTMITTPNTKQQRALKLLQSISL